MFTEVFTSLCTLGYDFAFWENASWPMCHQQFKLPKKKGAKETELQIYRRPLEFGEHQMESRMGEDMEAIALVFSWPHSFFFFWRYNCKASAPL